MDFKNFIKSKTLWGALASAAALFGIGDLVPADIAETAPVFIDSLVGVVGFVLTVYGRFTAKDKLTVLPKKKDA